ncbi:MAG TPA: hypothetical protein VE081_02055, partial [Sporichthyaceae bacterium]|nr:hypothetical protein [Sporichthyaceae bacterium]
MYVPRSPLRRRLVPIATLVALTAGAGALGVTFFSGSSPAAANPIVVPSPAATPVAPIIQVTPTSSPTPTP